MFKRPIVIFIFLALAAIGLWFYMEFRVPSGVEPKGEELEAIAWLGLAGGAVSFLTAIVGLIQKIVELRAPAKQQ